MSVNCLLKSTFDISSPPETMLPAEEALPGAKNAGSPEFADGDIYSDPHCVSPSNWQKW